MHEALPRHATVTLLASGWDAVFERDPALAGDMFVREWAAAGFPVIARRLLAGETGQDGVPVGLPTPPSAGKRRLAFIVPVGAVARVCAPVTLQAVLTAGRFPPAWLSALTAIDNAATRLGLRTRVFGSVMWQYLTGLPYVGPSSDVDLLWDLPNDYAGDPDELLQALTRIEARGGPRIDGELLINGGAVQWRELAMAEPDDLLLVKSPDAARLSPRRSWLAGPVRP
jgi:phosphoribosyl-dephospho-CoA transferase